MKFISNPAELLKVFNKLSAVMSNKNVLPIFDYFILTANKDGKAQIRSANFDIQMEMDIWIDCYESIEMVIPKEIIPALKQMNKSVPVGFEYANNKLTISNNSQVNSFDVFVSPIDFPSKFEVGNYNPKKITTDLSPYYSKFAPFIVKQDIRPLYEYLNIRTEYGILTMDATDGVSLIRNSFEINNNTEYNNVLIHKDIFLVIKKLKIKLAQFEIFPDFVKVNTDDYCLVFRQKLEGVNFPNFQGVLNTNYTYSIKLGTDFINKLKSFDKKTNLIHLIVTNNMLQLQTNDDKTIDIQEVDLDWDYDASYRIGTYQYKYLLKSVSVFKQDFKCDITFDGKLKFTDYITNLLTFVTTY